MSHLAVVLAAGQGTRLKSSLPKVLHRVAGRPMLDWVVEAVQGTGPRRTVVVLGHGGEEVAAALGSDVETCRQEQQLGTGDAVRAALRYLGAADDSDVLVVPGDAPLVTADLLVDLLAEHRRTGAALSLLTTCPADPSGYGRILRGEDGGVEAIVEEKDAEGGLRDVTEVNGGVYVFDSAELAAGLDELGPHNAQGEYYLTDVVAGSVRRGGRAHGVTVDAELVMGVNDQAQLAAANATMRARIAGSWMTRGVVMVDPSRTYIDHGVELEAGVTLYPGVHLEGASTVAAGATLGPDCFLSDSVVGSGARVWYAVLRSAVVGPGAQVGPYASLRPGTVLEAGAKAGTFVEMKNSRVGEEAKVPHLTYLGDATVGSRANVGAGTITCNYDGVAKHETVIGEGAFIGSDTMLVAPVQVGEGAYTGAGSVITRDVPPGALAVERAQQKEIPGYAARRDARRKAEEAEE